MSLVDFDAAWAEQEDVPFTWRVHGHEVEMPGSRPAGLVLHMHRVRKERGDDAELSLEELRVLAALLFGPLVFGQLLADRTFTEPKLTAAVMAILSNYKERESGGEPDDAGGKARAGSGVSAT